MKLLLVLLVVLVGVWLWRTNRQSDPKLKRQTPKAAPKPLDMVRCALCSIHVPSAEAIQGKKGLYCCADHRQRAES
jgi:uncharacterized protein